MSGCGDFAIPTLPVTRVLFCLELEKMITDPPGFEPGPEAPEASILSRLYYESTLHFRMVQELHDVST